MTISQTLSPKGWRSQKHIIFVWSCRGEYDVVDLTFFQECLFGIQEIAGIMEYDILLSICKNNDISSLERIISNRKVDGVILMRTFVEDRQIEYLQEKKSTICDDRFLNYTRCDPDRPQSQKCV